MNTSMSGGVGRYGVVRAIKFVAIFAIFMGLLACKDSCTKFDEIKESLEREIKIGDSRDQVELIFKGNNVDYYFDDFQSRYQSTVRDVACGEWVALSIYVNFDKSGHVSKIEISESYTGL